MTRILLVNSNTDDRITARIGTAATAAALPGTSIEAMSAPYGLPLVVTPEDWQVAVAPTLTAFEARRGGFDAGVIACFGDPGLDDAKTMFRVPMLGISEAAFHAATMLGGRFGVVSFTAALQPMFEACLARQRFGDRCVGFRMGPPFAGDAALVAEQRRDMLLALCRESVADGAGAVILAGGPLAGLAPVLQPDVAVPLVDGVAAAVRLAGALAYRSA